MAASLAAIGVDEHRWLGYSDGACADADEGEAITTIGEIIDAVEPRHDRHVRARRHDRPSRPLRGVGVDDRRLASRRRHYPPTRLWYATLLPSFHQEWGGLNDSIGIFPAEATPPETPDDEAAAIVRCDGWLARRKAAALRAHASQVRPLIDLVGEAVYDRWWSVEAFVDATRVPAGVS